MKNWLLLFTLLTVTAPFSAAQALDFNLFDANRGKEPEQEAAKPPPAPPAPAPKPPAPPKKQVDFMLMGTQIIGTRKVAYLQTPDGKSVIRQTLNPKGATPISGYKGYFLREVENREVQIAYPSEAPCQEHRKDKGVKCKNKNLAVLTLERGKPSPPRAPQAAPMLVPGQPQAVPAQPVNAAEQQLSQQGQAFKPRIIKDEEIPPGMKRIRTPFGDRLVPAQ